MHFNNFSTVSWECVHFLDQCHSLEDAITAAERTGLSILQLDTRQIADGEQLLEQLGVALEFPAYYGRNWDAFHECLADLSWLPSQGYVVVLKEAAHLWGTSPKAAGKLVATWLAAAEIWARDGVPFHLLFVW